MMSQAILPNTIVQVGLIVRDIEKTAREYCKVFGFEMPAIILTDPYEKAHTTYRGQPSNAQAKLAFFSFGPLSLELIEPVGGPSTWQQFLDEHGEGVHHIAFRIKDTDRVVGQLEEAGIPLDQQGQYTGGMYSYLDSADQLAVILELLEDFDKGA